MYVILEATLAFMECTTSPVSIAMEMNFFQCRSLKTRVTLTTLLIFLLGIGPLALYASRMLREDMQQMLGEQQFSTITFVADEIEHELDDRLTVLKEVAAHINPAMLNQAANLQTFLNQRLILQDAFNDGVIAYRLDGTAMAATSASSVQIGTNYMTANEVAAALKEGKPTIGKPHLAKGQTMPEFALSVPILDIQGQVIGALEGNISLAKPNFLEKVTNGRYGKTGGYVLVAPQHQVVVTASDKSRIMASLPAPGINPTLDRYAKGYEGTEVFVNPIGIEVLSSVKAVPVAGWYAAVALPTEEAFAPIQAMQRRILLATLFLTLLAGYLTWWILRRQLAPLVATAKTLASFLDTNQPLQSLPIVRKDEVGHLIGSFNRLFETLAQQDKVLKESEAFKQAILNSVSSEIAVLNHEGVILAVNQPWCSFGIENSKQPGNLAPGTGVGANYLEVCQALSGASNEALQASEGIQAVLDGRLDRFNLEYPCHAPQIERWFNMSVTPLSEMKQGGAVITHTDISAQKRQQMLLKLAAQVFEQGHEGITVTDAQGDIIMTNKAFSEITGYSEAEVLGKNPHILSSGRQSPAFYSAMWTALNTTGLWAGEVWNRRKDGTHYPEWLSISVIKDDKEQTTHYVGNFRDLSDTKAAEDRIHWLSHFDALTGLPNHILLRDRTTHSINMMQSADENMTMMLVGIDHFKDITDTLGHHVGDELLIEVAHRLSHAVRAQDTVGRLDGKEFILVLPGTPASGASHLATELLRKLALPYQLGDHELTVTASIGIASYPSNGSHFDDLIKSVEIAMHRAQASQRNSFQFYSTDMFQEVLERDQMVKALRHAAELDQFQLLYQPLVDLQTGHISGMEALLRWQHPEMGAISPVQFIPLAEESGLIKDIGEWVLKRACRDIRIWLDKGIKVPHVAINVSPIQFLDNDLVAQVKNAVSDYQIDPALIYIEVTESALMEDVQRSEDMLHELKSLGVKLSLDDFGTGYSSLSYLKRFPFDKVKIDQSFVRDIATSQSDNVLVKVIVSMAHGLGLRVIAEGVETETQCEIMRSSICDEIQGYFFSRPITSEAIEAIFAEDRQLPAHLLRLQKPQRTLLLVDDEPNVLSSLKRLFRRDGHIILTANSGLEGLEVLSKHKVDIIISDQRMPGMTGVEFLRAAKVHFPDTIRIVLSGFTELQSVTDAINEGAVYRFLTKPWEDEQLREHVRKAFEYRELLEENRQLDIKIRTTNQELVAANRQLGDVLKTTRHQIERDETSLAIVREALQHIPLPVIGVDDEGMMAFVNAAAESLFKASGPLLGVELAYALPAINSTVMGASEGVPCELLIEQTRYLVKWNKMGLNSRSQGRLVTLTKMEGNT